MVRCIKKTGAGTIDFACTHYQVQNILRATLFSEPLRREGQIAHQVPWL